MYFDNSDVSYLDTYSNDLSNYIIYKRSNLPPDPNHFNCDYEKINFQNPTSPEPISLKTQIVKDGLLRNYRLALSSTVEYSDYHIARAGVTDGTIEEKKAAVLSAMNATMTRVNGVYEKTISVTMTMVPNNDLLLSIGTDAYAPGFTNDDGEALLDENQAFIDQTIGNSAYDIGHIFSTGGGGIAWRPSVCSATVRQWEHHYGLCRNM